jgi:hypothetical protein
MKIDATHKWANSQLGKPQGGTGLRFQELVGDDPRLYRVTAACRDGLIGGRLKPALIRFGLWIGVP